MEHVAKQPKAKYEAKTYDIKIPLHVKCPEYTGVAVKAKRARDISVLSNHYNIDFPKGKIFQWDAKFSPALEAGSREVMDDVFEANFKDIITTIGKFVRASNCLFTFALPVDNETTNTFSFGKHQDFTLTLIRVDKTLDMANMLSMDVNRFEVIRVINFQIKNMMKALGYNEFGIDRKYFDNKKNQVEVLKGDFILNVMKGFKSTMEVYSNNTPKLLIDCCCKIVREYSLWDEIQWYQSKG
jgi:hypothetical protein